MFGKEKLRTTIVCLILTLGTGLLYWPVVHYGFINFDDPIYVVINSHLNHGFSWRGLAWCFQPGYGSNWHPLTWLSHMFDCQLFGIKPGAHHFVNLLLHCSNSVLLFLLLQRLTKTFWRSAVVAALFAWHPMHVESVAWVAERKDVLSACFWMLTIWAYVRYAEEKSLKFEVQSSKSNTSESCNTQPAARLFYFLTLFFLTLGLMSKPMVVTLPFVLLLLDFWPLHRMSNVQSQKLKVERKQPWTLNFRLWTRLFLEKIPFFVLMIGASILTVIAQRRGGSVASLTDVTLAHRIGDALIAYGRYIQKLVWPTDLALVYPLENSWPVWEIIATPLLLIGISIAAFRARRQRPYYLVGWLWFLGTLVPVIGLVQVGVQSMADRYTYIPSIGLFVIVGWGVYEIFVAWRCGILIMAVITTAILLCYAAATSCQLPYWQNSGTIFSHALAVTRDNFVMHTGLGTLLKDGGDLKNARVEFEESLRLRPDYSVPHNLLGEILLQQGKLDEAATHFKTVIAQMPHLTGPRVNLGNILLKQKLPAEAATQFARVVQIIPDNPLAHLLLGKALTLTGQFDEAHAHFVEALRLQPENADTHYQLALLLSFQKKMPEAILHYREALHLRADFPDALNNLAWILAANANPELRNGTEAVQMATRACSLTTNAQTLMVGTLAAAYAEAGSFDEAVAAAQKAHDLAITRGEKELAEKNLELLELYRSHRAYHENP